MMERSISRLQKNRNKTGIISTIVICLFLIAAALGAIAYRQRIVDQIMFWNYSPTSKVTELVSRTGMNENGKFYFYASQPTLYPSTSAEEFNSVCEKYETTTAILGCYDGVKIFIYEITDKKLDGINEVTAVHETLHAIYNRLSDSEKSRVNKLIETEYKKISNNKYYTDLTAYYAKAEPGQRDNELHSIIGTEVAGISPELEKYYNQYFSNRQKIVDLDIKYSSVFKSLKTKADKLGDQLDSLSASIALNTKKYNTNAQNLNNDISRFNERAASGDFSSQSQFDSDRAVLVSRAAALERDRVAIKTDIARYEAILNEYNSIAMESKKLYDTINSTLVSSPSV